MAVSDKVLGSSLLVVAVFVFVYYTTWAILLPFLNTASPLHRYFPPREWAIRLPAFLLVVGLSGIGWFVGATVMKERAKRAQKAKLRAA